MPRGPTAKCPFCRNSLSNARVAVPRSGKIERTKVYVCRKCGASVTRGTA